MLDKQVLLPLAALFLFALALPRFVGDGDSDASAVAPPSPVGEETPVATVATQPAHTCDPIARKGTVTFRWQALPNASLQWLDISTASDGFPAGMTASVGPPQPWRQLAYLGAARCCAALLAR